MTSDNEDFETKARQFMLRIQLDYAMNDEEIRERYIALPPETRAEFREAVAWLTKIANEFQRYLMTLGTSVTLQFHSRQDGKPAIDAIPGYLSEQLVEWERELNGKTA